MFNSKTVFVLGAGASHEIGLPLGKDLLVRIARRFGEISKNGTNSQIDRTLWNTLTQSGVAAQSVGQILGKMSQAMVLAPSIDNYIFSRSDDSSIVLAAKTGIALELIEAERASAVSLTDKDGFRDPKVIADSWYGKIFELLNERVSRVGVDQIFSNVTVINFNYDRSFKNYMFKVIKDYFELDHHTTVKVMESLQIIHPYGNLGPLEWETATGSTSLAGYGKPNVNWPEATKNIQTFNESIADPNIVNDIGDAITYADKLVFLGFAYHEQNIDLLARASAVPPDSHLSVLGSAYGLSGRSQTLYENILKEKIGCKRAELIGLKCRPFFDECQGLLNS